MQIDFDHAYRFCKEIANSHYENFPVGSLLIPSNKRKYIYSIYAFARYADDIADSDNLSGDEKLRRLNELDDDLSKIEKKDLNNFLTDTKYIFIALSNTIDELKIPIKEFRDLLKAFRQDAVKQRYTVFEELVDYSKLSANPIGHLVLYVFGYTPDKDKTCFEYSDSICTALQLTNFWQDVSVDLKIDRIYIPEKLMNEYNYNENMLHEKLRMIISEK
ncbi:MAG: squalene/phytoene synthase family protein [Ignavibacteria bacterium]|nr:squalene/phytoene synthase family protein [Ignavibacteria bacterium]